MATLLPWLAAVIGLASAGWLTTGLALKSGRTARLAAAIFLPGLVIGIGIYVRLAGSDRMIPDPHEASLTRLLTVVLAGAAATLACVMAVPVWFALESRFGYRAHRD